ncbi:MAG: GDP-mannose 4,6-dehydratase, partial [Candidatus Omnitrophica bacterium]|nr:GDP-mannose 4,6-dehydratase [Candidatus Omnitrophota bacterium]
TMLQQESPEDFVIGTGQTHSVKEFADMAFKMLDLDYRDHVKVDKDFFRPAEVDLLVADCTKAKQQLNWDYRLTFEQLIEDMVKHDYEFFKRNSDR